MVELVNAVQGWLPLVGFVLPLFIGLLTASSLDSKYKTFVMLLATGIAALVNQVDANAGILTTEMLGTWGTALVVTVASYYGVWKPVGAGNLAPNFGIGATSNAGAVEE